MSDAKLDQILDKLTGLERDVAALKTDVGTLKTDVSTLKSGQESIRGQIAVIDRRQDETVTAFKQNWSDIADLYRRGRDDLQRFEDRMEAKLSQVNQSIQALRDSIERQDFRADELGRRISRLEDQPRGLGRDQLGRVTPRSRANRTAC